jgi:GMP reductase
LRIIEETKLNIDDLLLVPQRNTLESRSQVVLEREFKFYHSARIWNGVPVFCSNMAAIAGIEMGLALAKHKMCTALHKFHDWKSISKLYNDNKTIDSANYIWPSIGMNYDDITSLKKIKIATNFTPNIVIDVPNGYIEKFVKFCADVRSEFLNSIIMAGNVTTPEAVQELIIHGGVDIVKTNIGPGSQCTTRLMTGVGYGTASTTMECAGAAHGLKSGERKLGLICADGGMKYPGDFAKNFALGADFCMAGGFFAGLEENCGEWECDATYIYDSEGNITPGINRKSRLKLYGMSSKTAQEKHYGEYKKYRASEGRSSYVDYRGCVDDVVQELLGSLRSTATYIGAHSLKDFSKCAVFCKVNQIHPNTSL